MDKIAEIAAWVGRKVRIVEGPSPKNGAGEVGVVICVDATDYRPAAWVKVGYEGSEHPNYRSCDLCWLVDIETDEDGPVWTREPNSEDHGRRDGEVVTERIHSFCKHLNGE